MSVTPLAIVETGMVTAVGLDTAASCAAIRCTIDNFRETRFMDGAGEPIIGSEVEFEPALRGRQKLLKMAAISIQECIDKADLVSVKAVPLILCLPESTRPGRTLNDDEFFTDLQEKLALEFAPLSRILVHGHTAVAVAFKHARSILAEGKASQVLICGVDSLLCEDTLAYYEEAERLLTSEHSNGFIPGEAAATLLVEKPGTSNSSQLLIHGLGFSIEKAHLGSGIPLRADGLTSAIKASLNETGCAMHDMDYRIADITGEHYYFKEASLALSRTLHERVEEFDILHPTDCVGETGSAIGPLIVAYQHYLCTQGHACDMHSIAHFSDADGKRAAFVMSSSSGNG